MHHLALESGQIRVLDVQIPPGETSLLHIHRAPIIYVAIEASAIDVKPLGGEWRHTSVANWKPGGVAYELSYAEKDFSHRVRNVGTGDFRLIAMTNSGPGISGPPPSDETVIPGEVENDLRWFRQSRVVVPRGESSGVFRSKHPAVVVQVSPGETEILAKDQTGRSMASSGSFVFVEEGHDFTVRNSASAPVTLVVIEAR